MTQTHTPGPWISTLVMGPQSSPPEERTTPDHYVIGESGLGKPSHLANIAHVVGANETSAANARLIVAAPELLAACTALLNVPRGGWSDTLLLRVERAVAKAQGVELA